MNVLKNNNKIYILRHGESMEDLNKENYKYFEDDEIPLSDLGIEQAIKVGNIIKNEKTTSKVILYISPSRRVIETANQIVSKLGSQVNIKIKILKDIRKQDWGKVLVENRSKIERDRYETGVLRYSFPNGEKSKSYLNRFKYFVEFIKNEIKAAPNVTRIIITHGFELRLILMNIFNWDEVYFESLEHPNNCEIKRIITRIENENIIFNLEDEMKIYDKNSNPNFIHRKIN